MDAAVKEEENSLAEANNLSLEAIVRVEESSLTETRNLKVEATVKNRTCLLEESGGKKQARKPYTIHRFPLGTHWKR